MTELRQKRKKAVIDAFEPKAINIAGTAQLKKMESDNNKECIVIYIDGSLEGYIVLFEDDINFDAIRKTILKK